MFAGSTLVFMHKWDATRALEIIERGRWLAARDEAWPHGDPAQVFALFSAWANQPDSTGHRKQQSGDENTG